MFLNLLLIVNSCSAKTITGNINDLINPNNYSEVVLISLSIFVIFLIVFPRFLNFMLLTLLVFAIMILIQGRASFILNDEDHTIHLFLNFKT